MSESADPRDPPGEKAKAPRDPVRRWTIVVAAALLFLLALQIASDRTAPVSSIGTVEGLVLPISSRVSGELLRVAVSDDEIVEAGTLLFEIDPTPFRLAVEAAEADLAQVGQSIGASTADVAAAQARVAEAEAVLTNSRAQAERTLELVERGVTPAAEARQGDRGGRLGRGDRGGGRGRPAQRRGGAGAGGRRQPAAARRAGGAGDGAVRPEPDAGRGADARPGHQLQPRAGRDRHRRAAGPDDDRPAGRLDHRVFPREPARQHAGRRSGGGRARRAPRAGLAGASSCPSPAAS